MLLEEFEMDSDAPRAAAPRPAWYRRLPSAKAIALAGVCVFALNAVIGVAIVVQLHHANGHAAELGGAVDEFRAPAEHVAAFVESSRALLTGSVPNLANKVLRKDYAAFAGTVLRFSENFKRAIAANTTNANPAPAVDAGVSAAVLRADADLPQCSAAFKNKIDSCREFDSEGDCNKGVVGCNWCTVNSYDYNYNGTECRLTPNGRTKMRCVPKETAEFPPCQSDSDCQPYVYEKNCRRLSGGQFPPPLPPSPQETFPGANGAYSVADLVSSIASLVSQIKTVDDAGSAPREDEDNGMYLDVADYALSFATEQLHEDDWIKLADTCVAFVDEVRKVTWAGSYVDGDGDKMTWDENDRVFFYTYRFKNWCETLGKLTPSAEAAAIFANL